MFRADVNFDLSQLGGAMADMEARGKQMAPAFRELRRPLRGDQRAHARAEEGPTGRWQARSSVTEARNRAHVKLRRSRKRRDEYTARRSTAKKLLGRLPGAIQVVAGQLYVRATSRASWGGVHQFGGHAGHGRRVRIPARQFLWLSEKLLRTATEVLGTYVVKGWRR